MEKYCGSGALEIQRASCVVAPAPYHLVRADLFAFLVRSVQILEWYSFPCAVWSSDNLHFFNCESYDSKRLAGRYVDELTDVVRYPTTQLRDAQGTFVPHGGERADLVLVAFDSNGQEVRFALSLR